MRGFSSYMSKAASVKAVGPTDDPCEFLARVARMSREEYQETEMGTTTRGEASRLETALFTWFDISWDEQRRNSRLAVMDALLGMRRCDDPYVKMWLKGEAVAGTKVYRGIGRRIEELRSLTFTQETEIPSGPYSTYRFLRAIGSYQPNLPVQSWSTDLQIAMGFQGISPKRMMPEGVGQIPCVLYKKVKREEVLLGRMATRVLARVPEYEVVLHLPKAEIVSYLIPLRGLFRGLDGVATMRVNSNDPTLKGSKFILKVRETIPSVAHELLGKENGGIVLRVLDSIKGSDPVTDGMTGSVWGRVVSSR